MKERMAVKHTADHTHKLPRREIAICQLKKKPIFSPKKSKLKRLNCGKLPSKISFTAADTKLKKGNFTNQDVEDKTLLSKLYTPTSCTQH